ncbi:MAG TPA: hydroxyphenylacetyl-CoA thioesterase PaaI [Caulobacteraceae bacterium]|jgi:acyl-CoA thioesterase
MSGADERARRVADTMLAREGTGPAWALQIEDAREGYARVAMTLRPDMLNGHGTAHGGMVFALADTAFAYACNSRNETSVAQHASIVFLSPAKDGERLIAEAREQAAAGRSGLYYVTVTGPEGRVVAEFQGLSRTIGGAVVPETGQES